jgi:hypothetical protein
MPRLLSGSTVLAKNAIDGGNPFCFLLRVTIAGAAGQLLFTDNNEAVVFHGLTFDPFQIQLEPISEVSDGSFSRWRATFTNVDQQFASLTETYWIIGQANWQVEVWQVDATTPDAVPITNKDSFSVMSIATDLLNAAVELQAADLQISTLLPNRRYIKSGGAGFDRIPRIM